MARSPFVLNPNILGEGLDEKQGSTAFDVLSLTPVEQTDTVMPEKREARKA